MNQTILRCLGISTTLTTVMLTSSQGAFATSYARDMFYQQVNNVSSAGPAMSGGAAHTTAHTAHVAASHPVMGGSGLKYWIELKHGGRTSMVDSRHKFQSGDAIRFHIISSIDGYAHIILVQGSSGKSEVLFPQAGVDKTNRVGRGKEYVVPARSTGAIAFDNKPGREHIRVALTRQDVDPSKFLSPQGSSQVAMAQISSNPAVDPTGGHSQIQISMPEDIPPPKPVTQQVAVPSKPSGASNPPAIQNAIPDENDGKGIGTEGGSDKDMFRESAPTVTAHHVVHHASHPVHRPQQVHYVTHTYTPPPEPPSTVVMNTNANEDLYADITLEHQ